MSRMKTHVLLALTTLLLGVSPVRLAADTNAAHDEIRGQSRTITTPAAMSGPTPAAADVSVAAASATAPDRVGFPSNYRTAFQLLGSGGGDKGALVHTAFANESAAAVFAGSPLPFPNGSVIAMEFANPLEDGEGQPLRDARGIPLPGEVVRIDVMRRGQGFGAHYGEKRAGEWEFASYTPQGAPVMPPTDGAQCADCHRNAGANNDFVFRMRPTPGAP